MTANDIYTIVFSPQLATIHMGGWQFSSSLHIIIKTQIAKLQRL